MSLNKNVPQNSRVVYLTKPEQLFKKLDWEVDNVIDTMKKQVHEQLNHEVAAYHVFNAAVTAWHLTDWTWNSISQESQHQQASKFGFELTTNAAKNLKEFQSSIRKRSHALNICWDIANGSKHFDTHKDSKVDNKIKIDSTVATAGEFRVGQPLQSFSYDFIVQWDDKFYRIVDILEEVRTFWLGELNKHGLIGDIFVKFEFTLEKTNRRKPVDSRET